LAKIDRLDDAFSECFNLEASSVEGQSLLQRKEKEKKERQKKKIETPKILISVHARAKMS